MVGYLRLNEGLALKVAGRRLDDGLVQEISKVVKIDEVSAARALVIVLDDLTSRLNTIADEQDSSQVAAMALVMKKHAAQIVREYGNPLW